MLQLAGWGFSGAPNSTPARTLLGPKGIPLWRQTLFLIPPGMDYIQVKRLELTNSQQGD